MDKLEIPPRPAAILTSAHSIMREADPNAKKLGAHWLKRFFNRHPEYKRVRHRAIEAARRDAMNREIVGDWFQRLKAVIEKYGILDADIWNFDETGFQIGIGRDQWIVTRVPKKLPFVPVNTNREYITVVEAVSAGGSVISPLIILSAKVTHLGWFEVSDYAEQLIGTSDTGYMNDTLCYQWIQHFHLATRRQTVGSYRLLLCDGFSSHMTHELVKFCEEKKIILFFLPPKTSHILQPLDVGIFHAYKHWHSEAVADATATGCGKFTKVEFLHALTSIRKRTFKRRTIRHGFRDTGIVPLKPDVVISQLPELPQTPEASDNDDDNASSELSLTTPTTTRKVTKMWDSLCDEDIDDIRWWDTFYKLEKASQAQAHLVNQLKLELRRTDQAKKARDRRAQASHRHLASIGGVVKSSQVRTMVRLEREYDLVKEKLKWRRKWKTVITEFMDTLIARGVIIKRQRKSRQQVDD